MHPFQPLARSLVYTTYVRIVIFLIKYSFIDIDTLFSLFAFQMEISHFSLLSLIDSFLPLQKSSRALLLLSFCCFCGLCLFNFHIKLVKFVGWVLLRWRGDLEGRKTQSTRIDALKSTKIRFPEESHYHWVNRKRERERVRKLFSEQMIYHYVNSVDWNLSL